MAVTVEQLSVKISADAKEFSQVLGKITTQLDSLQNETSKVGKSIGGNLFGTMIKANAVTAVLGRTIGALGGTLKNVGTSIVKNGSSFSRLGVATQVVAKNAGITTEQLKGLNEQLVEANTYGSVADSVIRNLALSGLVQMADGLKAVDARTGETATGVNALVLSVKDLGAVAGVGSGQAIQEITRFINTGEQTQAVREMLAGIANLRIEYNEFGKELSAQEQAQARMNIVMREAGKSFGAYALTYETSGKIISSIGEVIRNIAEIIGSALEPILRVASSGILQLFNAIRASLFSAEDGFVDLGLTVRNWATSVAGYIVVVIRVLGALLSRLPVVGKNFNSLANFSLKNLKASDKLGSSVANTGGAMKDASKDAKALKKELAGLAGFDELNVLKEPDAGTETGGVSGAGALGGGLGEGGLVDIEDINKTAELVNAKVLEIQEKFKGLKKVFQPVLDFIIKFKTPILIVIGLIALFAVAIANLFIGAKVFGIITTALTFLKAILAPIVAVLGGISAPILIAVVAITALVAGFVYMYRNSETVRNAVQQLGDTLKMVMQNIWDAMQPVIEIIKNQLIVIVDKLGMIFKWLWENVLKPFIETVLVKLIEGFKIAIDIIGKVIVVVLKVAETVLTYLIPYLSMLWNTAKIVFEGIGHIVAWVWNSMLKPYLTNLWNFITGFIVPVLQTLWAVFSAIFNKLADKAREAWAGIKNAMQPVTSWIEDKVVPVIQKIADKFKEVWDSIKSSMAGVWEGISSNIKTGINWIIGHLQTLRTRINTLLEGASKLATSIPGGKPITYRIPEIHKLAKGGVVQEATMAMIGESGAEVVMPLENNTGWIDKLAERIGSGGNTIVVKIGEEEVYNKFIDFVNDKTMASNTQILRI